VTRSEIILNYEETEENWQWHHYTTRRDLMYRMLSNEDIQEQSKRCPSCGDK